MSLNDSSSLSLSISSVSDVNSIDTQDALKMIQKGIKLDHTDLFPPKTTPVSNSAISIVDTPSVKSEELIVTKKIIPIRKSSEELKKKKSFFKRFSLFGNHDHDDIINNEQPTQLNSNPELLNSIKLKNQTIINLQKTKLETKKTHKRKLKRKSLKEQELALKSFQQSSKDIPLIDIPPPFLLDPTLIKTTEISEKILNKAEKVYPNTVKRSSVMLGNKSVNKRNSVPLEMYYNNTVKRSSLPLNYHHNTIKKNDIEVYNMGSYSENNINYHENIKENNDISINKRSEIIEDVLNDNFVHDGNLFNTYDETIQYNIEPNNEPSNYTTNDNINKFINSELYTLYERSLDVPQSVDISQSMDTPQTIELPQSLQLLNHPIISNYNSSSESFYSTSSPIRNESPKYPPPPVPTPSSFPTPPSYSPPPIPSNSSVFIDQEIPPSSISPIKLDHYYKKLMRMNSDKSFCSIKARVNLEFDN